MKNKIKTIFLILIINLSALSFASSDEFIFKVTDLEILENNTIYKGNNRGKVITDTQVELESDNFIYLKEINRLESNGNVILTDIKSNITINAEKMFYLKSEEIIYTLGKTLINVDDKYNIEGYDITLLKNKMILFSDKRTIVTDYNSNLYKLERFQYLVNEEILKGEKIFYRRNEKENKEDEHYFETGFFNLKKNEYLGKDISIKFHKTLFDDEENDPRINAASGYGDEYNTYLDKAVFTSCKKTDKCPPWKMTAKNMQHDKVKKQIIYKNAWLQLYDFPVVYFPKFFHPDPSVERQSGLLKPEIGDHDTLGDSIYLPYFFVISDDKDITLKPRLFNDNRKVLQTEYRQETKNSLTIVDHSITTGHASTKNGKKSTRSHLFTKTNINLDLEEFIISDLEIKYEKISNDTYLKLFDFIKSPLWEKSRSTLTSKIELDLEHKDYDFISSVKMSESLGGANSDRYSYVLPTYKFNKSFYLENINGNFNFSSSGSHSINDTNISSTSVGNEIAYSTYDYYTDNGITTNYSLSVLNNNSISDKSLRYKNSPQAELMSKYFFDVSLPLQKVTENRQNTLTPKLNFRISPHDMKNHSGTKRRVNIGNVFSSTRLGLGDSFETGESITLGIDFKKEKVNQVSKVVEIGGVAIDYQNLTNSEIEKKLKGVSDFKKEKVTEIEEYFDFKLATVFRFNKEKDIPIKSTINEKTSNIFGSVNYKPIKNITLGYEFSLTNDFNTFEYNNIGLEFKYDNFLTNLSFTEEAGILGNSNVIDSTTEFIFKDYHNFEFSTRRNREINLTEYYDLVYEYKNDCLIAGIKYRKDYYQDADIVPKEQLFFSITIVPFYTFSPDKMLLNKDRKS